MNCLMPTEAKFKEFDLWLKFKLWLKYCLFYIKFYLIFQDLSQLLEDLRRGLISLPNKQNTGFQQDWVDEELVDNSRD